MTELFTTGTIIASDGLLYEALEDTETTPPAEHPTAWALVSAQAKVVHAEGTYTIPAGVGTVVATGAGTFTLPTAAGIAGRPVTVVNNATATIVTVKRGGSEKLKGAGGSAVTSLELGATKTYCAVTLVSDGTDWHVT